MLELYFFVWSRFVRFQDWTKFCVIFQIDFCSSSIWLWSFGWWANSMCSGWNCFPNGRYFTSKLMFKRNSRFKPKKENQQQSLCQRDYFNCEQRIYLNFCFFISNNFFARLLAKMIIIGGKLDKIQLVDRLVWFPLPNYRNGASLVKPLTKDKSKVCAINYLNKLIIYV